MIAAAVRYPPAKPVALICEQLKAAKGIVGIGIGIAIAIGIRYRPLIPMPNVSERITFRTILILELYPEASILR